MKGRRRRFGLPARRPQGAEPVGRDDAGRRARRGDGAGCRWRSGTRRGPRRVVLLVGAPGIGKTRLLEELRGSPRAGRVARRALSLVRRPHHLAVRGSADRAGSAPKSARQRSLSGPRLERSSVRCSATELDDVLPSLGRLLRLESTTTEAQEAPTVREAYIRWLEAVRGSSRWSSRSRTCTGRTPPRGSLRKRFSRSPSVRPSHWSLTEEVAPGSEGARLRLRAPRRSRTPNHPDRPRPLAGRRGRADARRESSGRRGRRRHAHGTRTGGGGKPPLSRGALAGPPRGGGLEPRGRTWTITRARDLLPPALENLLVARIDRLPRAAREVCVTSPRRSVATFPVAGTGGDRPVATSVRSMTSLLRAEIVRETRRYPVFECSFTHGLLHDAALSTVTSTRKRELYARVASAFESLYADSLDDHAERLAHYHARQGICRRRSSTPSAPAVAQASARATSLPRSR